MKFSEPNLLLLLRWKYGQLDGATAEIVKLNAAPNGKWHQQWRLLSQAGRSADSAANPSVQSINGVEEIEPPRIAAFIESRLSAKQAAMIESECWRSPALLNQIDAVFDMTSSTSMQGDEIPFVRPELTKRLLKLGNTKTQPQTVAIKKTEANPQPIVADQQIESATHLRSKTPMIVIVTSCLAASLVLTLVGVWWVGSRNNQPNSMSQTSNPKQPTIEPAEETNDAVPDANKRSGNDASTIDLVETETNQPDDSLAEELMMPKEKRTPVDPINPVIRDRVAETKLPIEVPKMPIVERNLPNPSALVANPSAQPIRIVWESATGIIAIRNQATSHWSGWSRPELSLEKFACIVCPGSVGKFRLESLGSITIAPNTRFELQLDRTNQRVTINLQQGGIQIECNDTATTWQIQDADHVWKFNAESAGACAIVDAIMGEEGERLWVNSGSIYADGNSLKKRQALKWTDGSTPTPTRVATVPDWVDGKIIKQNSIPTSIQQKLADSSDVLTDLTSIVNEQGADSNVARFCLMTIDATRFGEMYLANVVSTDSHGSIQWLMQLHPDQQQFRQVMVMLGRQYHAPDLARSLPILLRLLQQGKYPQQAQATVLLKGLEHRMPEVRRLALEFLLQFYGAHPTVVFNPYAEEAERRVAANGWRLWVNQLYSRMNQRR